MFVRLMIYCAVYVMGGFSYCFHSEGYRGAAFLITAIVFLFSVWRVAVEIKEKSND